MSSTGQSKDERSPATADEAPAPANPPEPPPPRRRDPGFRIALLEKLPALEFTSWSAREDFETDVDWAGIVSLRSDSVLGPLEPLAPTPRTDEFPAD
jgi:hypothetical protein